MNIRKIFVYLYYTKTVDIMAIGLKFKPTTEELTAKSKWWGAPDLPADWEYPCQDGNPLTFVCQIRCEDLAAVDSEGMLPHSGMLYFFAAIGEYVNKLDIAEGEHNGLGEWGEDAYKVLYTPTCDDDLVTYKILYDDEEPAFLPAEEIIFERVDDNYDSFKLLGRPYYEEIAEQYPDHLSLLQIDESDEWGLMLYDCGMVVLLAKPEDIKAQRWDNVLCYFHSF